VPITRNYLPLERMREIFHPRYEPRRPGHLVLPGLSERQFEHLVFDEISRSVGADPSNSKTQVRLTPRSADRGKDVVVTNLAGRALLGFQYSDAPPSTVVVECKLTRKQRLAFEHVAGNLLQLQQAKRGTFLLITNASLTPRSLWLIQEHCDRVGAEFQLIDAYNFDRHFPAIDKAPAESASPLQISYQVLPNVDTRSGGYTVHLVVRSFSTSRLTVDVGVHSTRHWAGTGATSRSIAGEGITCFCVDLRPTGARSRDTVTLVVSINGVPELYEINLSATEYFIDLPIFGFLSEAVTKYDTQLREGKAPDVLLLHAPSGTGKSRLLKEIGRRASFDRIAWFVMRDDDTAVERVSASAGTGDRNLKARKQSHLPSHLTRLARRPVPPRAIFIDDVHLTSPRVLDEIEKLVLDWREQSRLILCGRSDPAARRPRYEAFAHLVQDHGALGDPHLQHMVLPNVNGSDVSTLLQQLLPGNAADLVSGLAHASELRPVEVVQYIHSLLERRFVYWADENRLAVNVEHLDSFKTAASAPDASAVLDGRLEFLATVQCNDFTALELFVLLALADKPSLTFSALDAFRRTANLSAELLSLWFREDVSAAMAFLAHDTITERLIRRAYRFQQPLHLARVIARLPEIREHLSDTQYAVVDLHARDFRAASHAMATVAAKLGRVRNVSSLSLEDVPYEDVGALLYFLHQHKRPCDRLARRAAIARAYLDMHQQDFVNGLLDCIGLLTVSDRSSEPPPDLTQTAVRQLMAHGLLNSGDLRTALSLMHEVENSLLGIPPSRLAHAVEFDMCDRLQSYYTQQSCFDIARGFLLRGRQQAYLAGDEALVNISLSAEFHLYRYIDSDEAARLAQGQRRHAEAYAPLRSRMHALVNDTVAQWSLRDALPSDEMRQMLKDTRAVCARNGYGHLVPRIDYLAAVDTYRQHVQGYTDSSTVGMRISNVMRSAHRYGYGEYSWLADNLRLLCAILSNSPAPEIVRRAERAISDLARDGLTFVGGEYLCFQNVVVLSNALRALHKFGNEDVAWHAAEMVQFSPLICSGASDREQRIQRAFDGGLLITHHDPAAILPDPNGYFTILV
jgi:hypothetical protein